MSRNPYLSQYFGSLEFGPHKGVVAVEEIDASIGFSRFPTSQHMKSSLFQPSNRSAAAVAPTVNRTPPRRSSPDALAKMQHRNGLVIDAFPSRPVSPRSATLLPPLVPQDAGSADRTPIAKREREVAAAADAQQSRISVPALVVEAARAASSMFPVTAALSSVLLTDTTTAICKGSDSQMMARISPVSPTDAGTTILPSPSSASPLADDAQDRHHAADGVVPDSVQSVLKRSCAALEMAKRLLQESPHAESATQRPEIESNAMEESVQCEISNAMQLDSGKNGRHAADSCSRAEPVSKGSSTDHLDSLSPITGGSDANFPTLCGGGDWRTQPHSEPPGISSSGVADRVEYLTVTITSDPASLAARRECRRPRTLVASSPAITAWQTLEAVEATAQEKKRRGASKSKEGSSKRGKESKHLTEAGDVVSMSSLNTLIENLSRFLYAGGTPPVYGAVTTATAPDSARHLQESAKAGSRRSVPPPTVVMGHMPRASRLKDSGSHAATTPVSVPCTVPSSELAHVHVRPDVKATATEAPPGIGGRRHSGRRVPSYAMPTTSWLNKGVDDDAAESAPPLFMETSNSGVRDDAVA